MANKDYLKIFVKGSIKEGGRSALIKLISALVFGAFCAAGGAVYTAARLDPRVFASELKIVLLEQIMEEASDNDIKQTNAIENLDIKFDALFKFFQIPEPRGLSDNVSESIQSE